jgi:subfamily B ATP-binding cassette protein MsbA
MALSDNSLHARCAMTLDNSFEPAPVTLNVNYHTQLRIREIMFIENSSSDKQTLLRLVKYFAPHKVMLLIAIVGLVGFSIVDAGMIYFIQPLIDEGLAKSDGNVLKLGALLVIVIFMLRGAASFISNYCMAYIGSKITFTVRRQAFSHLQYLPLDFFQKHNAGKLISKITYDAEQISKATSEVFIVCIRESLIVLVLLGIMFHSSWQLSLIFLIVGPVIGLAINYVSKRFKHISLNMQNAMGEVTRHTERSISSHREVLAFATQSLESSRFSEANNNNRRQYMKLATTSAISNPTIQLIASLAIAGVLWLASLDAVIGQTSAGAFTTTLVAMGSLLRPLKQLTNINQSLQRGLVAASSLFGVLDEPVETDSAKQQIRSFSKHIKVRNLNFSYSGNSQLVLKNVSFTLNKGQTIALVGESGSGKSSIANLLMRFYITQEPHISIDDIPLNQLSLNNLRQQFSLVSQQVVLFNDSIAANIAYGCHQSVTTGEIEEAARVSDVWGFAEKLPEGLDTYIGENGGLLSGGQRQRIAIARAILRDAPILILDEATSALDTKSENRIQQTLSTLQQHKTTIVIAHRLSTIQNADQILVMENGSVCEQGTHQELLLIKGAYYHLYQQQFHDSTS